MTIEAARNIWPDVDSCSFVYDKVDRDEHRYYRTPVGVLPGVTTVLKVLGLKTEGLLNWATSLEREACLTAATESFLAAGHATPLDPARWFRSMVEQRLSGERAHIRQKERAGDIGSQIHSRIKWFLAQQCGMDPGPMPAISDEATRGYISFTDWWGRANLKPKRVEQPLWCVPNADGLGWAGTADLIAEAPDGFDDVYDFKSGKGLYLEYHMQVRAYVEAARGWAPIRTGVLVRLPKTAGEAFDEARDVEPMGEWRYGKRMFGEDELLAAFRAALIAWSVLKRRPDFNP